MADGVAITAGAGTTIHTDERTINSVSGHVQRVNEQGSTAVAVGTASVTTTSGSAVAARETRKRVVLISLASNSANMTVGPSGVASGTGPTLAPGASVTLRTTAAIHADAASGTQSLEYIEEYDS